MTSLSSTIEQRLQQSLQPYYLSVENESFRHQVPKGSELHFKIIVVANEFKSITLTKRHQIIYQILQPLLKQIHALAIHCYTPEEWTDRGQQAANSPPCQNKRKSTKTKKALA